MLKWYNIDKNYCHSVYDFTKIDKSFTMYFCAHRERILKKLFSFKNSFSLKKYIKRFFHFVASLPYHVRECAPSHSLAEFSIRCSSCGKLRPLGRCYIFLPCGSLDIYTTKLNNMVKSAFLVLIKFFLGGVRWFLR